MSKDDCKVGCKHKERKPKKPHYIPRPWGKPYNYKCFQCPFTCMEKSHLYNHMKYSLCKNSLSLLIESDWPYKKGHPLHPDQLRLQQGNLRSRSPAKSQPETPDDPTRSGPGDGENAEEELVEMQRETEKEGEVMETNGSGVPETCQNRRTKQEADAVMADVFSLEEQLLRARSIEVESKLRNYRLSKTCLTGPALLSEQWRFLSNQTSNTKPKSDTVSSSSLSCYPPPSSTGQLECSDTPAFNLSLLGYPLTPSLLSYLNPVTAGTATAQISPLPFLGSNALAHSQRHSDRSLIPPHLYYPFLCEHSFATPASTTTSSETGKMIKPSAVSLPPPSYPTKLNLWKVPALRPVSNQSSPAAWLTRTCSSPEQSHGVKDRLRSRETRNGWQQDASFTKEQSLKRTAASQDSQGASVEKKAAFQFALDSLINSNKSSRLLVNNSARSEASSPPHVSEQLEVRQRGMETETDPAAALLQDFSTLLHEYQNTEQRAASLPEQSHLWAHLGKIRSELSHIQQALERTARFNEGPLDLSVKKDLTGTTNVPGEAGETKDVVDENYLETEEEEDDDDDEGQTVRNRQKCTLDTLMKLHQSQGPVVKTEVMSDGGLAIRSDSADVLWHSTTTKCEADSSVLLCSKTPNRPPSIQHLDTLCPTSPLTTTDTMV